MFDTPTYVVTKFVCCQPGQPKKALCSNQCYNYSTQTYFTSCFLIRHAFIKPIYKDEENY